MISRSWKIPAVRSTRPFRLWGQGENQLYPQPLHGPSELDGRAGWLIFRLVLEDRAAVGVQGKGYAEAPQQALHQPEVAAGILHDRRTGR